MKKLIMLLVSILLFSCNENEFNENQPSTKSKTNSEEFSRVFAGDSLILENPYSVRNMRWH